MTSATTATIRYPEHDVIIDRHPFVHAVSNAPDLGWVAGWTPTEVLWYDGTDAPVVLARTGGTADFTDYTAADGTVLLVVYVDDETSQNYCWVCRSTAAGSCPACSFCSFDPR